MSLIKCFECGTKVSEYAEKCPSCGCPISAIKEKNINTNKYLITFNDGEVIDLNDIENKISENELNGSKLWEILENYYDADIATCSVIDDMFKFNNYKFPNNYQDLYEAMCEHNVKSREARETNLPKCPTCGSTQVKRISTTSKVVGATMFGLFSKTARSQFECLDCKYKW